MHERNRVGDLARGLAALSALIALVAGVPVALVRLVGSPLPAAFPKLSEVGRALSQSRVADSTLIKAAALICWVAWAVLVACVVAELVAWVLGRTVARVPVVGPFQMWAARLVASAMLVFGSVAGMVRPAVAMPTASRASAPVVHMASGAPVASPPSLAVVPDPVGGTSALEDAVALRPALPAPGGAKRYIVDPPNGRQRDTLWGIAERHLGNPERWPEIFQLNKGRISGGHRMNNPHWIYAGEELIMPPDAVGLEPAPVMSAGPVAPVSPSPAVGAQSSVEMQVIPDSNASAQPQAAGRVSDGWRIVHTVTDLVPPKVTTENVVGGGIFAAAVVALLDRRRRTRQRRQRPGMPVFVPGPELASTELALRVAADVDGAELARVAFELTCRSLSADQVLGMRVGSRQAAIRFVGAAPAAESPFRSVGDGWVLPRRAVTHELVDAVAQLPTVAAPLVTLGTTDEGESVLLNLRAAGVVSVAGSRTSAVGFLLAAATELAAGDWIHTGRLVVVGLGDELGRFQRVVTVPSAGGVGNLDIGDVIVSAEPLGAVADELPDGVAILGVGPVRGSRSRLVIVDDRLEADVLDAVVRPPMLRSNTVADIAELLEPVADGVEEPVVDAVPVVAVEPVVAEPVAAADEEPVAPGAAEPSIAPEEVAGAELEVRVLGPVEIVGAEKPLARAKSIELVVYLALHRDAVVDADRLREALWPGRPPGTTLYTTASVARNHLGRGSDGEQHLPLLPNGERGYRLGNCVRTDYDRFADGVQRAKDQKPAEARETLRAVLELVRGRPFEVASRGYEWAHVEGFIVCIENEIADAAHQLARLCLDAGDAKGARWAARQGLRASAGNEQLYRDAMEAADLEGNRAGVEALMNELAHVIEEDCPLENLHPDTVALYNELTSGERAARLARTGS